MNRKNLRSKNLIRGIPNRTRPFTNTLFASTYAHTKLNERIEPLNERIANANRAFVSFSISDL